MTDREAMMADLIDRLAECADWLGSLSTCKASDDCLVAARSALARATGDAYYMPQEVSDA
jgi:hypothetical protein